MKSKLTIILIALFMTGCAQLGAKVTTPEGFTMSEKAYIAEKQHAAETECYRSRSALTQSMPANPSAAEAVAVSMGNVMAMMVAKDVKCGGTNVNDVAIAKAKARWGFAGALTRAAVGAYGVGQLADFGTALANAKSQTNTYNTSLNGISQSTSSSGGAGSGAGALAGEEGLGGAGGVGGGFNQTESGIESNSINIGGQVAISGDRAAAGEDAILNGDSSVVSNNEDDVELKGANIGEDVNTSQDAFNDPDGENGQFEFDL